MAERHTLKAFLRGVSEPVFLPIEEQDVNRLNDLLQEQNADASGHRFFYFSSPAGIDVAISLRDLQLVNLLWEPEHAQGLKLETAAPDEESIRVYVRDRAAFVTNAAQPRDVMDVFDYLALGDEPFLHFLDEDGERVFFRRDELVLLTAPSWYMKEAEGEAAEETERENKRTNKGGAKGKEKPKSDRAKDPT